MKGPAVFPAGKKKGQTDRLPPWFHRICVPGSSTAADHRKNAQLVTVLQFGIKGTMTRGNHRDTDRVDIDIEVVDYPGHGCVFREFPHFLDESAITEEGEESDSYLHLKIPKCINFLAGEIPHDVMGRQGLITEEFRQSVIRFGETGCIVEGLFCF